MNTSHAAGGRGPAHRPTSERPCEALTGGVDLAEVGPVNQALQENSLGAKTASAQQAAALVKSGQQASPGLLRLQLCQSHRRRSRPCPVGGAGGCHHRRIQHPIPPMTVLDCAPIPGLSHLHVLRAGMRSGGPGKAGGRTSPRSPFRARWTSGAGRPSIRTWPFFDVSPPRRGRAT
ncbi:MAG: hypothetical protein ACLT9P_04455 [Evtepia gabavorous]